jgi:4-azaleucine resistance transporter AzlC
METQRQALWAGIKAELPIALGVTPFGLIYGVLALGAGLPPLLAMAMSGIVFAGSAQFIGVELIGGGAATAVIWFTTFIVNLRHLLYSASLAPHVGHLPARWRWLLAYLLTDEAYVVAILHYDEPSPAAHKHWYFLGTGLTLWGFWQASTAVGVFLGAQAPAGWSLDFTLALTFIGLVVPSLEKRPHLAAALVAGAAAVLAHAWPYQLGLLAAACSGVITGVWMERRQ